MPENKVSFSKMRSAVFFALIIILGIAMLYLFRPFFYPIFWAAVITVMFRPFYLWLEKFIKSPSFRSIITIFAVLFILILPLSILAGLLVRESISLYGHVSGSGAFLSPQEITARTEGTFLEPLFERVKEDWSAYATTAAKNVSTFLFTNLRNITQDTLKFVFMLFVMFYSLFYFFKDGPRMLRRLMYLLPIGNTYEEVLYREFTSTTRATLKSTIIVGGIQGVIGGILFWITGVPGALVWGVIMTALAIIPAVGAFVVWLPAGLIMLALGNMWQGLTIILVGVLLISTIDNLVRPPLIGKDIEMHPLIVFFSTLGGIFLFGISGFVIGPVLAAFFLAVIKMYDHYYRNELQNN